MKSILMILATFYMAVANAQDTLPPPIEERHPFNYTWWIIGVIIILALGIGLYMLIKKDPKKDAV